MFWKMRSVAVPVVGLAMTTMFAPLRAQTPALQRGLDALYRTAEAHNATLRSLQTALREAEAGVETARMAKLPDVSGQASISYLGNARIWNRRFGESTSAPMPHYGNNFLLRAQQVVYGGGAVLSGIELARQSARMASLSADEGRQRVRFLLTGLYLQLHALRNEEAVYRKNADLARSLIGQMERRREQGVSLKNDVTRYELQLRQMLLGEATASDQQCIVRRRLSTALGTDSAQVSLLGEEAFSEAALAAGTEADWQQRAAGAHAGLKKAALGVDMSQTKERLERAGLRPKVSLLAEDHLDGPITVEVPPLNKNLNYWFVGVGVSYDFSSLYKVRRKVRQARLATAAARDGQDVAREEVADAVHAAYVELGTARTRLATQLKSVQLAAENYDVVSKRYQNGLALVTDLTDAANMKLEAELALANARIDLVYSYYNLRYAAGDL